MLRCLHPTETSRSMKVSGAHLVHILLSSLLEFALYCLVTPGVKHFGSAGPNLTALYFQGRNIWNMNQKNCRSLRIIIQKNSLIPSMEMEEVVSVSHTTFLPDLCISSLFFECHSNQPWRLKTFLVRSSHLKLTI